VSLEDVMEKETEDLSTQPYHHGSDFEEDRTKIIIQDIMKDFLKDFSWESLKTSMEKVNFFKIMLVHFRTYFYLSFHPPYLLIFLTVLLRTIHHFMFSNSLLINYK